MYNKRKLNKKSLSSYILPLFLSLAVIILIVLIVNLVVKLQTIKDSESTTQPIGVFNVEYDNVSMILNGKSSKLIKGLSKVPINNDEGVDVGNDSKVSIDLSNSDVLRMNKNSSIIFNERQGKIVLNHNYGNFWIYSKQINNNQISQVKLAYAQFDISEPAEVMVLNSNDQSKIIVIKGKLQVKITDLKDFNKDILVGVGQELDIDNALIESLKKDPNIYVLKAISDDIKMSEWYVWNMKLDGNEINYQPNPDESEGVPSVSTGSDISNFDEFVYVTSPNDGDNVKSKTINVKGKYDATKVSSVDVNGNKVKLYDNGTWIYTNLVLESEGKNQIQISFTNTQGEKFSKSIIVNSDSKGPEMPILVSPKTKVTQNQTELKGIVGDDVVRVDVNGYTLKKFIPNSGSFVYYLSSDFNMKSGTNTYKVIAYDKSGNASEPLVAEVEFSPTETAIPEPITDIQKTNVTPSKTTTTTSTTKKSVTTSTGTINTPKTTETNTATDKDTTTSSTNSDTTITNPEPENATTTSGTGGNI